MKTALKKSLMFLLSMAIVFGATTVQLPSEPVQARTIYDVERELEECKSLLRSLQNELSAIKGNIDNINNQAGADVELAAQYQAEIEALEAEMQVNSAIKDSYDIKRAQVVSQIAVAREDYEYRVSMYLKLMQFVYENGGTNSFELLFSSKNISEFLTRRDNFNDIIKAANRLIEEIEDNIKDLEALDAELAATQAEYDSYDAAYKKAKSELERKIEELNTVISGLQMDKDQFSNQYANKNEEIKKVKARIAELEDERKEMYSSTAEFIWPVPNYSRVTSGYGYRKDPINGKTAFHNGVDIAASRGTPILAVKSGVVTRANWYSGFGNCVIIYHGDGISTLYGHCDNGNSSRPTFEVKEGDAVKAGDVIAYIGTTGRSTGYHLHFSVLKDSTYVNPDDSLPDGYYTKNNK